MRGLALLLSDAAVSSLSHRRIFDMAKRFLEHAKHAPSLTREFYSGIISTSRVRGLRESTNRPGVSLLHGKDQLSLARIFHRPPVYMCTLVPYVCITRGITEGICVHSRIYTRDSRRGRAARFMVFVTILL